MLLKDRLADLMAVIDPKMYRKFFIINRKGGIMLYVKIQKGVYGLLISALCRNLLYIYSQLNLINPSTNSIFPPK